MAGIDVITKEKLLNVLKGLRVANDSAVATVVEMIDSTVAREALRMYCRGFDSALEAVAGSCGLDQLTCGEMENWLVGTCVSQGKGG